MKFELEIADGKAFLKHVGIDGQDYCAGCLLKEDPDMGSGPRRIADMMEDGIRKAMGLYRDVHSVPYTHGEKLKSNWIIEAGSQANYDKVLRAVGGIRSKGGVRAIYNPRLGENEMRKTRSMYEVPNAT